MTFVLPATGDYTWGWDGEGGPAGEGQAGLEGYEGSAVTLFEDSDPSSFLQVKKKAKWIRKAMREFREYEEKVVEFKAKHPEFNPPSVKSFLTQEEQKILDK